MRESHRSLDPREGKRDTAAKAREESARAGLNSRRGLNPLVIPDQGTRSHMPKLKIEDPVCHYSQINKLNFKSVKQPRPPPKTAEERALSGG